MSFVTFPLMVAMFIASLAMFLYKDCEYDVERNNQRHNSNDTTHKIHYYNSYYCYTEQSVSGGDRVDELFASSEIFINLINSHVIKHVSDLKGLLGNFAVAWLILNMDNRVLNYVRKKWRRKKRENEDSLEFVYATQEGLPVALNDTRK